VVRSTLGCPLYFAIDFFFAFQRDFKNRILIQDFSEAQRLTESERVSSTEHFREQINKNEDQSANIESLLIHYDQDVIATSKYTYTFHAFAEETNHLHIKLADFTHFLDFLCGVFLINPDEAHPYEQKLLSISEQYGLKKT
jgi:hypothetical protein